MAGVYYQYFFWSRTVSRSAEQNYFSETPPTIGVGKMPSPCIRNNIVGQIVPRNPCSVRQDYCPPRTLSTQAEAHREKIEDAMQCGNTTTSWWVRARRPLTKKAALKSAARIKKSFRCNLCRHPIDALRQSRNAPRHRILSHDPFVGTAHHFRFGEAERILCLGPIASGDRLLDFFDERANASGARDIDRGATDSLANSFLRRFVVRHDLTSCELCRGGLYRLPPSRSTD